MAVVLGSFDTQTDAEGAMDRIKALGLDEGDFSIVVRRGSVDPPPDQDQQANTQVDVAVAGGAAAGNRTLSITSQGVKISAPFTVVCGIVDPPGSPAPVNNFGGRVSG